MDNLCVSGGGSVCLFLVLLGDKMLGCQSEGLWLSFEVLAADEKKSISTNLFGLFPVFYKDEATQYAFMSLGFNGSLLLK